MLSSIKIVLMIVLAGAMTYMVLTNVLPETTNYSVSNESKVCWTNGSATLPSNRPFYTLSPYTPTLRYKNGTTNVENYTFTASGAKIGANVANGTYYAYYTYYKQPWIAGTNYVWMIAVLTFIMAAAILMKFMRLF